MSEDQGSKVVELVGRAYVVVSPTTDDCALCIDTEEVKGIVFGFFTKKDVDKANNAAEALNRWAGFVDGLTQTKTARMVIAQ